MAKLKIVTGEDSPILREKAKPVKNFDAGLKTLVKNMKETMLEAGGLGLAAPQVGESKRVFLVVLNYKTDEERVVAMVNPIITMIGEDRKVGEEGCLSLPGRYGKVVRYERVNVEFADMDGNRQSLDLDGLDAREIQHENDHLNGILFIDRMKKGEKEEDFLM